MHGAFQAVTAVSVLFFLFGCAGARAHQSTKSAPEKSFVQPELPQPIEPADDLEVTDRVVVKTNHGAIVLGLFGKRAPDTVANFLKYVDSGFYANKVFHRVIPGFMIQGGGFAADLTRDDSTDEPVRLELIPGFTHEAGTLSMARTNDPMSATSQFFICVAATPQLNGLYAAFGRVEEGLDVVNEISTVKTASSEAADGVMDDVPVVPVVIESVSRLP